MKIKLNKCSCIRSKHGRYLQYVRGEVIHHKHTCRRVKGILNKLDSLIHKYRVEGDIDMLDLQQDLNNLAYALSESR